MVLSVLLKRRSAQPSMRVTATCHPPSGWGAAASWLLLLQRMQPGVAAASSCVWKMAFMSTMSASSSLDAQSCARLRSPGATSSCTSHGDISSNINPQHDHRHSRLHQCLEASWQTASRGKPTQGDPARKQSCCSCLPQPGQVAGNRQQHYCPDACTRACVLPACIMMAGHSRALIIILQWTIQLKQLTSWLAPRTTAAGARLAPLTLLFLLLLLAAPTLPASLDSSCCCIRCFHRLIQTALWLHPAPYALQPAPSCSCCTRRCSWWTPSLEAAGGQDPRKAA